MPDSLDAMYRGEILVFGHRGARDYAPMNTMPAFELAAKLGADGIELDAHFSKDRAVVIVHDFTVDSTTNGSGRVSELTLSQLQELDAGGWFGEAFRGARIPTLDEVFEAVGQKLFINVEIKVESGNARGLEEAIAGKISKFGLQRRVIVSSFDLPVLERLRKIMPEIFIGFLHSDTLNETQKDTLRVLNSEAVHPLHELIDRHYMIWARENGYHVNTWTVNDPTRAIELRRMGVNGIISDYPDVILQAFGR